MQVVILAGGLATRLGDLTRNQPKSMVKVREKPFLEHQLELLKGAGVKNVVLCIGHMGEQIESYFGDGTKHGVNIKYSVEDMPLGTAGALKKAGNLLNGVFFTLLKAMKYVTENGGRTIGLSGFDGGPMKEIADVCIVVPVDSTPQVESFHLVLEHLICSCLRQKIEAS